MRRRTLVTAVIMFAALGTGTAGAFSFGGSFLPGFSLPAISIPFLGNLFGGGGTPTPTPTPTPPPSASCAQYGCATTTTVRCSVVVIRRIIPARCTATVRNVSGTGAPTGTVTFVAQGRTATCTLHATGPGTSSCSATLPLRGFGLFIRVTGTYSGAGSTFAPSSGSTRIIVAL